MVVAAELAQRMRDEGLQPTGWSNGPGDRYAAHDHGYDKVIVVERGSIRFGVPAIDGAFELEVGDRLELPAATTHDALVGPNGVACLEAHLSPGSLAVPRRRSAGSW